MGFDSLNVVRNRATKGLLDFAEAIPKISFFTDSEKSDLLDLIERYSTATDDIQFLAMTHMDVVRDVEFINGRMVYLVDEAELQLNLAWSRAYARARESLVDEARAARLKAAKPTEEQVKNRAVTDEQYRLEKMKCSQVKSIAAFIEGLRKGLYPRSVMIKILSDIAEDLEGE